MPASVIDPAQLVRIEAVHRGFLYQHLYAVALLLVLQRLEGRALRVEADEDIEVLMGNCRIYLQVKSRSSDLTRGDIAGALAHFSEIRSVHASGERPEEASFGLISNAKPNGPLAKDLASEDWPVDTTLCWPETAPPAPGFPPASADVASAVSWCIEAARDVPYKQISNETLVWKLAAIVQGASAGQPPYESHEFVAGDLHALFDQVVLQLHDFPAAPTTYRPHENEPALEATEALRILAGISGAGKTSWASAEAMHSSSLVAYYDAVAIGGSETALSFALARELGARWLPDDALTTVMLPGGNGLESLRAVDIWIHSQGLSVTAVVDNVQSVPPKSVAELIAACPSIKFVLLSQPWEGLAELEARLGVTSIALSGWGIETIAAAFADAGCSLDPATSTRIRQLTGGMPLYVRNALMLVQRDFANDADRFCTAFEGNELIGGTAQSAILGTVLREASKDAQGTAAVLSMTRVPLSRDEAISVMTEALSVDASAATTALTDLIQAGVASQLQDGGVALHDAFRPLAIAYRLKLEEVWVRNAATILRRVLLESISSHPDPKRSLELVRLLPLTGDIRPLIEFASTEFFAEYGLADEFETLIARFADDESNEIDDRFLAFDSLAFERLSDGNVEEALIYLGHMENLVANVSDPVDGRGRILIKKMAIAGSSGEAGQLEEITAEAMRIAAGKDELIRVIRYMHALALFRGRDYVRAAAEASSLVRDYYDLLGLELSDVVARNVKEIRGKLGERADDDVTIKHLADSLHLYSSARKAMGESPSLATFHALKFYEIAHAVTSIVKVGQDVVDEFLGVLNDAQEARRFIEGTLLPAIKNYGLLGHIVPVRAQYAVILAYCGDYAAAEAEIAELEGFVDALSAESRREIANQRALIGKIRSGEVKLGPVRMLPPGYEKTGNVDDATKEGSRVARVGRNDRCPCGSGRKYKRCHGR